MEHAELGPTLACPFLSAPEAISGVITEIIGARDLSRVAALASPEARDLLGLALNEVLHTVNEFSGEQTPGDASFVELWTESRLAIVVVKFRGRALPDWILTNWDRAREPAVLAPPCDAGWGWLLVREAFDAVSHSWAGSQQLIFLERRV